MVHQRGRRGEARSAWSEERQPGPVGAPSRGQGGSGADAVGDLPGLASAGARGAAHGSELSVLCLQPRDREWTALLERCAHDFYHLPGYAVIEAQRLGGVPKAFAVVEGDSFLLLPLVIREISLAPGFRDGTSPYGYPGLLRGGDLARDPAWLRRALAALLEALAERRVAAVFVRLHPLLDPPLEALRDFGTVVEHGETVLVDLCHPEDRLFTGMRLNHRRGVKRLRASGVTARLDEDWARLDDFVDIYHQTMRKVNAAPWYLFPREYLDGLRRSVGPALKLSVVERDGELLAGGIFSACCGIVQYHLGATSATAPVKTPSCLLLYSALEWGRATGNSVLHLGGGVGGKSDSLFHFKAGFSSGRATFSTWRAVPLPLAFRSATKRWEERTRRRASDGFFPPYREGQP